jgi:hypothetical protein
MSILKMSYLSHMGAKHVAWCSPVEKSPRSGHMAHELWHDMLCFMGVYNDLLLRIWYPCMIYERYACLWLKCDMDRLLHVKRAFFWKNCLNLKILLCHMLVFSYITCGNALTMLWFICVIFVSFLAFDTRFGLFEKLLHMFICCVLHFCIFTLIHTLSTRGRRGELNENSEEVSWNLGVCICSGGAFLLSLVGMLSSMTLHYRHWRRQNGHN